VTTEQYVKTSTAIGAFVMVCMAIILIGQYRIYPKVRAIETGLESLEARQSQQTRPSQSSEPSPPAQPGASDAPIQRAQPCAGGDD
jgi:hypothetical protein